MYYKSAMEKHLKMLYLGLNKILYLAKKLKTYFNQKTKIFQNTLSSEKTKILILVEKAKLFCLAKSTINQN